MTARYFPASMSSLRKRTSSFVYAVIPNITRLSPIHRVSKRQERDVPHEPQVGLDVEPAGLQ